MSKKINRINNLFELPGELIDENPKITILGFNKMLIENYKGILEYQDFFVRIKTKIGIININGYELNLAEMTDDDIMINGKIESVDFEKMIDDKEE